MALRTDSGVYLVNDHGLCGICIPRSRSKVMTKHVSFDEKKYTLLQHSENTNHQPSKNVSAPEQDEPLEVDGNANTTEKTK